MKLDDYEEYILSTGDDSSDKKAPSGTSGSGCLAPLIILAILIFFFS